MAGDEIHASVRFSFGTYADSGLAIRRYAIFLTVFSSPPTNILISSLSVRFRTVMRSPWTSSTAVGCFERNGKIDA